MFRFLRTYLLVLAALIVLGLGVTVGSQWLASQGFDYGAPRPTPATLVGYELAYDQGAGGWVKLRISADGKECETLAASSFLRDACVLTVNIDPSWIAAPAVGKLNTEDTPSYAAITWRAALATDPSMCNEGGLMKARLDACRAAAASGTATFSDGDLAVTVSSGQ